MKPRHTWKADWHSSSESIFWLSRDPEVGIFEVGSKCESGNFFSTRMAISCYRTTLLEWAYAPAAQYLVYRVVSNHFLQFVSLFTAVLVTTEVFKYCGQYLQITPYDATCRPRCGKNCDHNAGFTCQLRQLYDRAGGITFYPKASATIIQAGTPLLFFRMFCYFFVSLVTFWLSSKKGVCLRARTVCLSTYFQVRPSILELVYSYRRP